MADAPKHYKLDRDLIFKLSTVCVEHKWKRHSMVILVC